MTKKRKKSKTATSSKPDPALVALFVSPLLEFMTALLKSDTKKEPDATVRRELLKQARAAFEPIAEAAAEHFIQVAGAALGRASVIEIHEWKIEALRWALAPGRSAAPNIA